MIYIASDHGGYKLKKRVIRYLNNELEIQVQDLGNNSYDPEDDYTDYASKLAKKVREDEKNKGILLCRNGIGVCITANKYRGIRAGIGYNIGVAESMKTDDDTNVLCLAADHSTEEHTLAIIKKWLETEFSNKPRHIRRLNKLKEIESS